MARYLHSMRIYRFNGDKTPDQVRNIGLCTWSPTGKHRLKFTKSNGIWKFFHCRNGKCNLSIICMIRNWSYARIL